MSEPRALSREEKNEGACASHSDGQHCEHWWDGDRPCCACGWNEPACDENGGECTTDWDAAERLLKGEM